jgi:glycosyltransferase involved in cell wall biosynthesis
MLPDDKKRLVQVSASLELPLGGPVTVVKGLNVYLKEVFELQNMVFGTSSIDLHDQLKIKTFADNRYGFLGKPTPMYIRKDLAAAQVLLVHGYYLYSTLVAIRYSKTDSIFLMPHGSLENYQSSRGKLRKRFFDYLISKLLGRRSFTFLVGSNSEVTSIMERFPAAKVVVVGLGVENNLSRIRKLRKPDQTKVLICISRIAHKKRIDLCIRALAEINHLHKNYVLKIYGSGDISLRTELEKLALDLGVAHKVFFYEFVTGDAKNDAFRDANIMLLPSENENFAIAVAESICELRPVVVSKFVAMHEFVDRYRVGITIPATDHKLLSSAILDIDEEYNAYVDNCEAFRNLLTWEFNSKVWLEALTRKPI